MKAAELIRFLSLSSCTAVPPLGQILFSDGAFTGFLENEPSFYPSRNPGSSLDTSFFIHLLHQSDFSGIFSHFHLLNAFSILSISVPLLCNPHYLPQGYYNRLLTVFLLPLCPDLPVHFPPAIQSNLFRK